MQFTLPFLLATLPYLALTAPTPAGVLDTVPLAGTLFHNVGQPPVTGASGGGAIGNLASPFGGTLGTLEAGLSLPVVGDLLTPGAGSGLQGNPDGSAQAAPSVSASAVPGPSAVPSADAVPAPRELNAGTVPSASAVPSAGAVPDAGSPPALPVV